MTLDMFEHPEHNPTPKPVRTPRICSNTWSTKAAACVASAHVPLLHGAWPPMVRGGHALRAEAPELIIVC